MIVDDAKTCANPSCQSSASDTMIVYDSNDIRMVMILIHINNAENIWWYWQEEVSIKVVNKPYPVRAWGFTDARRGDELQLSEVYVRYVMN